MKSKKLSTIVISAIILALFDCGMTRANLVTNGGFELYANTPPKDFTSNCLPIDWSTGGYVFLDAPGTAELRPGIQVWGPFPATSPQLGNFIESDGSSGLAFPITQTVSGLAVGQSYNVSFYQAAGQELNDSGATTEQWQVSLGSQTQFSNLMFNASESFVPWQSQTLSFTASSTSEALSFLAIGSGGVPPIVFLDGVDMETNVPEPSALLLLAGVGVVAVIGRLRRRACAKSIAV